MCSNISKPSSDLSASPSSGLGMWGWNESWEKQALKIGGSAYLDAEIFPARVVEIQKSGATAVSGGTSGASAKEGRILLAGAFAEGIALPEDLPAVGDWLLVRELRADPINTGDAPWLVQAILPRKSFLARRAAGSRHGDARFVQALAANVDTALLMTACGADFSPGRVERLLALCHASGVNPLVVLSKIDLARDPEVPLSDLAMVSGGTPVLGLSAATGAGMAELELWLKPGGTLALLGSSGVGKSTLLNALAGHRLAETSPVREGDGKGVHTTSHRELYRLRSGLIVLDSPGLREVQLWVDDADIDAVFPEIAALASSCKFRDCTHRKEPGCAVLAALEAGSLDQGRYSRWRKMIQETAFLDRREDRAAAAVERAKWKAINKAGKALRRDRASRGMP
ncbi:MAG: ribosome small subunit-dependent GTPase A [bacterium]